MTLQKVPIDVLGICGGGCEADEDNDGICEVDSCVGIDRCVQRSWSDRSGD